MVASAPSSMAPLEGDRRVGVVRRGDEEIDEARRRSSGKAVRAARIADDARPSDSSMSSTADASFGRFSGSLARSERTNWSTSLATQPRGAFALGASATFAT